MLPPRRVFDSPRSKWICPDCTMQDRPHVLGVVKPLTHGNGHELVITRADVTVRGSTVPGDWRITCSCGCVTHFQGYRVRLQIPAAA